MQEGAIGGKHGFETTLSCQSDELWQQRVEQGLSHEMEVEETSLAFQLTGEQVELFCRELSLRSVVLRTEVAVQVARVGYFYITAVYHTSIVSLDFLSSLMKCGAKVTKNSHSWAFCLSNFSGFP